MAALLNGTTQRIEAGTPDVPASTPTLSIMGWGFPTDTDFRRLLSKATGSGNSDHTWMLSIFTGPIMRSRINAGGSTLSVTGGSLTADTWQHQATIYDGTDQTNYVDAVFGASGTNSGDIEVDAAAEYWIGANPGSVSDFWEGDIEDTRIYARAILVAELQCIVISNGHDGIVHEMILRHPLNDNTSGTINATTTRARGIGSLQQDGDGVNSPTWSVGANIMAPRRRYR